MPLNETIVDTVSVGNLKTIGEMHDVQLYRQRENAISHDQRMDKIAEFHLAAHSKAMVETDASEAYANKQQFTGDAGADVLVRLLSALNSGQQGAKVAQTTPPETGK